MALEQFTNIDGDINVTTPWMSRAHGVLYRTLGYEGYQLSYTYVKREIPTLNGYAGPLTEDQYWQNSPSMYAKLSVHRIFSTQYEYFEPTLKVYLMGIPLDDSLITHLGSGRFEIDASVPHGYMYVEYVPESPSLMVGDQRSTMSLPKVEPAYVASTLMADDIVRCRKAIVNLQVQTGFIPSTWIGGPYNTIKSRASNIITKVTPVFGQHVQELQDVLDKVSDHIDSLSAFNVANPSFTTVVENSPYGIQYIEEVRVAINELEEYAIGLVT